MITVVCAGNARQFDQWCRERGINPRSREVIYASRPAVVEGMRGIEVVEVGTFAARRDAEEIRAILRQNLARQP